MSTFYIWQCNHQWFLIWIKVSWSSYFNFWTDILMISNTFDLDTSPLFNIWCTCCAVIHWRGGQIFLDKVSVLTWECRTQISTDNKMHSVGPESNMQSSSLNQCTYGCSGSNLVVIGTTWWSDSDCQCLPEAPFLALLWKYDEIHTHLGGYWWLLSERCIWRRRSSMVKSPW